MVYSFYSKLSTEVYELSKPIGHSFGDVEFYKSRLEGCKGKILEPAVGTGRILIPLLEAGFDVEGMDNSPEMLSLCKTHCKDRGIEPVLYEKSMSSFEIQQKYSNIIVPTGSFLLIENRRDSLNTLKCFYEHLETGGRLIIDIFLPTNFETGKVNMRTWETPDGDLITLEQKLIEVDLINQLTVSLHKYEKWQDKKLIETELERFPLRWYGVEEFKLILEQIGFSDIVISSDYNYGAYPNNANQTITFEAYRTK